MRASWWIAAVALVACSAEPDGPVLPDVVVLAGEGPALIRLFDDLSAWSDTPLAVVLAGAPDLSACSTVEARAPEFDLAGLLAGLRCAPLSPALDAARGDAGLLLSLPVRGTHAVVRWSVGDTIEIDAHLPDAVLPPLLRGLEAGSGPSVLSGAGALLHGRIRTTGIAATVAAATGDAAGQGERLFALGSSILAGSILDGTVEVAWYSPPEGGAVPPLAVALGAKSSSAVAEGTARYVAALQERWPIATRSLSEPTGQCLDGLRVMPDFAPCWVAMPWGVALGWNESTLRRALEPGPGPSDRAVVHIDRFGEADAVLRRARGLVGESPAYPWRSLEITTEHGDGLRVRARLVR